MSRATRETTHLNSQPFGGKIYQIEVTDSYAVPDDPELKMKSPPYPIFAFIPMTQMGCLRHPKSWTALLCAGRISHYPKALTVCSWLRSWAYKRRVSTSQLVSSDFYVIYAWRDWPKPWNLRKMVGSESIQRDKNYKVAGRKHYEILHQKPSQCRAQTPNNPWSGRSHRLVWSGIWCSFANPLNGFPAFAQDRTQIGDSVLHNSLNSVCWKNGPGFLRRKCDIVLSKQPQSIQRDLSWWKSNKVRGQNKTKKRYCWRYKGYLWVLW